MMPVKMTFVECITLSSEKSIRAHYMTPFRNIHFYASDDEEIPDFQTLQATGPIDWLAHARSGLDVRFLMCEIIRLQENLKDLGELAEMDLEAGRWLLNSLEDERSITSQGELNFQWGLMKYLKSGCTQHLMMSSTPSDPQSPDALQAILCME